MTKHFYPVILPFIFLLSFSVYLATLHPVFEPDDSAEMTAACVTLTPSHPSGYPLYTLLGSLAVSIHLGDEAFRLNLFAAFVGAIGIALTFFYISRSIQKLLPECAMASYGGGSTGALVLAFSKSYWAQAVTAKGGVYMFQTLFCLGWFYCVGEMTEPAGRRAKLFLGLAGLIGLGLSNGWEMALVMDLAGVLSLLAMRKGRWIPDRRWLLSGALLFLIGSSCYLLLPLKPQEGLVWGKTVSWRPFLHFLSFQDQRQEHQKKEFWNLIHPSHGTKDRETAADQVVGRNKELDRVSEHLVFDVGVLVWPLMIVGGFFLYRKKQVGLLAFGSIMTISLVFIFAFVISTPDENLWCIDKFLIPVNLFQAVCAGIGGGVFWNWSQEKMKGWIPARGAGLVCGIGLMVFPALSLATNFTLNDQSSRTEAYWNGAGLMRSLQKRALFLAEGDNAIFPVFYFQKVLHRRPDVTLVPAAYLWTPWGGAVLEGMGLFPGGKAPVYDPQSLGSRVSVILDQWIDSNRGRRPVQFSAQLDLFDRCYFSLQPEVVRGGSLFPFLKPWGMTLTEDANRQADGMALLTDLKWTPPLRKQEGAEEALFDGEAQVFFNAAEYGVRTHQSKIAERFYPLALRYAQGPQLLARIWEGWGDDQAAAGSIAGAREAYQRSINAEPTAEVYARLIRSYFAARQYGAAADTAQRCVQIFPDSTQARRDLALCQSALLAASRRDSGSNGTGFQKNKVQ